MVMLINLVRSSHRNLAVLTITHSNLPYYAAPKTEHRNYLRLAAVIGFLKQIDVLPHFCQIRIVAFPHGVN